MAHVPAVMFSQPSLRSELSQSLDASFRLSDLVDIQKCEACSNFNLANPQVFVIALLFVLVAVVILILLLFEAVTLPPWILTPLFEMMSNGKLKV